MIINNAMIILHFDVDTDTILEDVKEWLNRPLKPLYSFVFVDCIYVKMR